MTCLAISEPARTSCFTFYALRSACLYPEGQGNHQRGSEGLSLYFYSESQIDKASNHFFVLKLWAGLLITLKIYLTVTEVVTNFDGPFLSQGITLSYHSLYQGIDFLVLAPPLPKFIWTQQHFSHWSKFSLSWSWNSILWREKVSHFWCWWDFNQLPKETKVLDRTQPQEMRLVKRVNTTYSPIACEWELHMSFCLSNKMRVSYLLKLPTMHGTQMGLWVLIFWIWTH